MSHVVSKLLAMIRVESFLPTPTSFLDLKRGRAEGNLSNISSESALQPQHTGRGLRLPIMKTFRKSLLISGVVNISIKQSNQP
jgi:hypothetical protein